MTDDTGGAPARRRRFGAPKNWRETFLACLAETSNVTAAAQCADISLTWVYKTKREDRGFADAWLAALCEGYDHLEMELLFRLRTGESREVPANKYDNATALRLLLAHKDTAGASGLRNGAYAALDARLGYDLEHQDYFAGFVLLPADKDEWRNIDLGIDEARTRGVTRIFVWALPQICRDGFVRLPDLSQDDQMQAFDDVAYPLALGIGTSVTPEFSTNVTVTASGFERRNSVWADARLRFDVGPGIRSEADLGALLTFFRARRGAARGFRLRDPSDFSSNGMTGTPTALDQRIGTGDGLRTAYPLVKLYGEGAEPQVRRITRPVAASLKISVDGAIMATGWSLGARGTINFAAPPGAGAIVRAGYLFDVPVRFAEDHLQVSGANFAAGEAPNVPVVEIREDV